MVKTISMEDMRHLNLFNKITNVSTRFCFPYNDALVFCVPQSVLYKAIGDEGRNIKKMREILRKKIKIVPLPLGIKDAKKFVENIVSPVTFKDFEITDDEMIISAGRQSKAMLIGRDKRRLKEMQEILRYFFKREFKIV